MRARATDDLRRPVKILSDIVVLVEMKLPHGHAQRHRVRYAMCSGNGWGCWAAWGWSGPAYTLSLSFMARPSLFLGSMPWIAFSTTLVGCFSSIAAKGTDRTPPGKPECDR